MSALAVHYGISTSGRLASACGAHAQVVTTHPSAVSCGRCRRSSSFIQSKLIEDWVIETDEEVVNA